MVVLIMFVVVVQLFFGTKKEFIAIVRIHVGKWFTMRIVVEARCLYHHINNSRLSCDTSFVLMEVLDLIGLCD